MKVESLYFYGWYTNLWRTNRNGGNLGLGKGEVGGDFCKKFTLSEEPHFYLNCRTSSNNLCGRPVYSRQVTSPCFILYLHLITTKALIIFELIFEQPSAKQNRNFNLIPEISGEHLKWIKIINPCFGVPVLDIIKFA